jgi:hypothetical protein
MMFSKIKAGRRLALVLTGVVGLSALAAGVTPSAASASDSWCGDWLRDPAVAYGVQAVSGTQQYDETGYFQVNQGYYGPHWYAWAQEYNAGRGPGLNWVYRSNGGIYTCYPQTEAGSYTAGVPDYQTYKVQAELEGSPIIYGPAVYWGG